VGTLELTEADAGAEHAVDVGQELVVRLKENRTTGFHWQLAVPPEGLAVDDDGYEADGSGRPGASGVRVFRLRATHPGTHRLGAALRRPWESGDGGQPSLEFAVTAR
jgi:predicted secreted protein